jgi:hypothetical protein
MNAATVIWKKWVLYYGRSWRCSEPPNGDETTMLLVARGCTRKKPILIFDVKEMRG